MGILIILNPEGFNMILKIFYENMVFLKNSTTVICRVFCSHLGEMREWLNRAASKAVVQLAVPRVRIPLSPKLRVGETSIFHIWRDGRAVEGARLESVCIERYRGFESPSLRLFAVRPCASMHYPTPSGPEGSSGQWCFTEPQ